MSGPKKKEVHELTAAYLRKILHYAPVNGRWKWRVNLGCRAKPGARAGSLQWGYLVIQIHGRKYRAHNLAVLYMKGRWPAEEVDHREHDPADCRWEMLREATRSQNMANTRRSKNNKSGLKGAYFHKKSKRWYAAIGVRGRNIHLGSYGTPEEAHAAYVSAAAKYFGEFARAE